MLKFNLISTVLVPVIETPSYELTRTAASSMRTRSSHHRPRRARPEKIALPQLEPAWSPPLPQLPAPLHRIHSPWLCPYVSYPQVEPQVWFFISFRGSTHCLRCTHILHLFSPNFVLMGWRISTWLRIRSCRWIGSLVRLFIFPFIAFLRLIFSHFFFPT